MGEPSQGIHDIHDIHLAVVILAAGQGTRMKSARSKVLHAIAGRPMLAYPLALAESLAPERLVVVIGRDAGAVEEAFAGRCHFVVQEEQCGTGHAVQMALPVLAGFRGDVLILYGDTPLLQAESIQRMLERRAESGAPLVMLSSPEPLPGRVVRNTEGRVQRVVEVTDATPAELAIQEGNTGVYLVDSELLAKSLSSLDAHNRQGELYLTDIVQKTVRQGLPVEAICLEDAEEALGVNDRVELARATAVQQRRNVEHWMREGVTFLDPATSYIDTDVEIGADSQIDPGVVIRGTSRLAARVHVKAHSVIESSQLDEDVVVGPYAHLRPGSRLRRGVRVGNFVEIKNSDLGEGVKADHLAYIGDADVGPGSAFGCGSITVNYDWDSKHRTRVGSGVNIGCNANLIAPVEIEDGAAVAAGSTVTRNVPERALAVARSRQKNVEGWRDRRPAEPSKDP